MKDKKLKKSQLRNMVQCELCKKMVTKAKTSLTERWCKEADDIITVRACEKCTKDDWMDE
jgi:hypothetical protein